MSPVRKPKSIGRQIREGIAEREHVTSSEQESEYSIQDLIAGNLFQRPLEKLKPGEGGASATDQNDQSWRVTDYFAQESVGIYFPSNPKSTITRKIAHKLRLPIAENHKEARLAYKTSETSVVIFQ